MMVGSLVQLSIHIQEVRKFDDVKNGGRAVWNEDEQRWEIPRLNLSGNAILMKKRMMNNQGLSRPETEYSRKMRTKDSNPRYRQDNIINLEIEMPGRSTESYDGSYRNRTICDILDSSINDEMEELSASSFVENENDVPGNPYFEYDDVSEFQHFNSIIRAFVSVIIKCEYYNLLQQFHVVC